MSRLATTCVLFGAIACGLTGCATYWKNRAKDFIDPFGFGLDIDLRYGFNVRATQFVQAGAAVVTVMEHSLIRFVGRHVFPESVSVEVGLAPFYHFRIANEHVREVVLGKMHIQDPPRVVLFYSPDKRDYDVLHVQMADRSYAPDRKSYERDYDRRLFDIGVSAYFGAGVDVEFNPFELVDFFLGWFGIDIASDDDQETPPVPPPDSYNAEALIQFFASESLEIRGLAMDEAKRLGTLMTEALCKGLKDDKSLVRYFCANMLKDVCGVASSKEISRFVAILLPALAGGLKDDDWSVRYDSADALSKIGAAARPLSNALRALLDHDPDPNVRKMASYALRRIGDD